MSTDEDVKTGDTGSQNASDTKETHVEKVEVQAVVYNPDYEEAVFKTALNPWSRKALKLYLVIMVGFLSAVSSGFDGSLMSGINVMDQYLNFFHYQSTGKSTGIIFMMYTVGTCAGSLIFAGPLTDKWGRRGGMFIGAIVILIGAAVSTAAQNSGMFLGGRFLLGLGVAIGTTAAPTWVTEIAPPQWRGRLGGMYNSCFFIGSIPATGAMVGTQLINSTWAWRLPLLLQVIPPTIVILLVWFTPESPRWLVSRGRVEEAKKVLVEYHSNDGEMNALIELELCEFREAFEAKKQEPWWDYSALVRNRNARWRMVCLTLMCVNGQLAGNGLITYFLPVVLKNAGVESSHQQLLYNFANSILSAFGAFTGAALSDKLGRRKRLYIGAAVLGSLLAMVGGLSSKFGQAGNKDVAGANASIAFILLFGIAYSFIYTPLQALYCAEVMTQEMRGKGMAVHILLSNIPGFINTFANSVGLGKLGWKYYFVFVAWDFVAAVSWWLFCVETNGRTLEELDEVFDQPWPARASTKKMEVVLVKEG